MIVYRRRKNRYSHIPKNFLGSLPTLLISGMNAATANQGIEILNEKIMGAPDYSANGRLKLCLYPGNKMPVGESNTHHKINMVVKVIKQATLVVQYMVGNCCVVQIIENQN